MTIDERLDRLTERHEALAESVQLLVAQGRESTERLDRLGERVDRLTANVEKLTVTVDKVSASVERLSVTVEKLGSSVDIVQQSVLSLVGVVRSHENRILDLEDGQLPAH